MNSSKKQLLGALIGLSRASESKVILESSGIAIVQGLALAYGDGFPENLCRENDSQTESAPEGKRKEQVQQMIETLHEEKKLMAPDCAACQYPCGRTFDYDMDETLEASEALREAKLRLLSLLGKIALRTQDHKAQTYGTQEIRQFLSDSLFQISCTYEAGQLTELIKKAEELA